MLLIIVCMSRPSAYPAQQPMFRANLFHTGVYSSAPLKQQASYARVLPLSGSWAMATRNSHLFAGTGDHLYAFDQQNGHALWTFTSNASILCIDACDTHVCIGTSQGLICVDPSDGSMKWQQILQASVEWCHIDQDSMTLVYIKKGQLCGSEVTSGVQKWKRDSGRLASPMCSEGRLYTVVRRQQQGYDLHALACETGIDLWTHTMSYDARYRPIPCGSSVIVIDAMGSLRSFDSTSGQLLYTDASWDATGTLFWASRPPDPVACGDSIILPRGASFGARIIKGGGDKWSVPLRVTTQIAYEKGIITFVDIGGNIRSLDADSGRARSTIPCERMCDTMIAAGDTAFVGTYDGALLAFDLKSGNAKWTFAMRPEMTPSISVDRHYHYSGGFQGSVIKYSRDELIDLVAGRLPHEIPVETLGWAGQGRCMVSSTPAASNGLVYAGGYDGKVCALHSVRVRDENMAWFFQTGGRVTSSPAVCGNVVYVGSHDGYLYALDATTGFELWRFRTGGAIHSSPAVTPDLVIVGSRDGSLYAINRSSSAEAWRCSTGAAIDSSPAVSRGMIYVGSDDGYIYAVDLMDGRVKWRFRTGGSVKSSCAVSGRTVYVGSGDGRVYAIESKTGRERWHYATNGPVFSSPGIAGDVLYIGSDDRHIYAIDADDGVELWRFKANDRIRSSPVPVDGVVCFRAEDSYVYVLY